MTAYITLLNEIKIQFNELNYYYVRGKIKKKTKQQMY